MASPATAKVTALPPPVDPFAFDTMVFEELPDLEAKAARTSPWAAKFAELSAAVQEDGKARGFYVPLAYYVVERKVDSAKVTHAYVKQKLNDAWNAWVKANASSAEGLELGKGNRLGTEEGYTDKGPGLLVIVKKRK